MNSKECIRLEITDGVAHIILDNLPDNRMEEQFFIRLEEIVELLESKGEVGAALIYSSGRHFSAGAAVEHIGSAVVEQHKSGMCTDEIVKHRLLRTSKLYIKIENLNFPVIAAIKGFCVGSGMELALASDIRVCSTDSLFGLPEISWGLITGCGGSIRLQKLIGKPRANEMTLSGEMVTAQEAYKFGLVNMLADKNQVVPRALRLAKLLADKDRNFVNSYVKRLVKR